MIGQSEKSGIEIECEYQLTGHPVNVQAHQVVSNIIKYTVSSSSTQ